MTGALVQHVRAEELDESFLGIEVLVCLPEHLGGPVCGGLSDVARYRMGEARELLLVATSPAGQLAPLAIETFSPVDLVDVFVAGRRLRLSFDHLVLVEVTPTAAEPFSTSLL